MTLLLGVIGDPIAHSLSPLIHNGWLRENGIGATYEAMQVPRGELASALETLSKRNVRGLNITLPHKEDALRLSADASEQAKAIEAANTLTFGQDKQWRADNTDVSGFLSALKAVLGQRLSGKKYLILGAGGSARAILYGLAQEKTDITVMNRTVSKAEALAESLGNKDTKACGLDQLIECSASADVVINTTSAGHSGGYLEIAKSDGLFFDISYGKAAVQQLAHARQQGWKTEDGLAMLVGQAAESFNIWFGFEPDRGAALERCCRAVEAVS